ncbi:hypothetical protein Trydic_g2328 [Trypoxylus dichotomus]
MYRQKIIIIPQDLITVKRPSAPQKGRTASRDRHTARNSLKIQYYLDQASPAGIRQELHDHCRCNAKQLNIKKHFRRQEIDSTDEDEAMWLLNNERFERSTIDKTKRMKQTNDLYGTRHEFPQFPPVSLKPQLTRSDVMNMQYESAIFFIPLPFFKRVRIKSTTPVSR